jgi:hypothetical protein
MLSAISLKGDGKRETPKHKPDRKRRKIRVWRAVLGVGLSSSLPTFADRLE